MASLAVFTTTAAVSQPPVGEPGVVTVTDDAEAATLWPALPGPKSTSCTAPRLAPNTVTDVPPVDGPEPTLIPVTTGQAFTGVTRSGSSADTMGVPSPDAMS